MIGIGLVLDWKFNSAPGIETKEGVITSMPEGIAMPTDAEITQWTIEYTAHVDAITAKVAAMLADRQAAKANAKLAQLGSMTPAQIQAWIDNNINTLADVKDLMKTFAVLIGILAREL